MLGLTGGYASGKSEVAKMFVELGAKLIDCDALAREVVLPGSDGLRRIVSTFGVEILSSDGTLNREAMATIIFSNNVKRKMLEGILHPLIFRLIESRSLAYMREAPDCVVVVEAPLLFESGLHGMMSKSVTVVCDMDNRVAHAQERDKLSGTEVKARISSQWPDTKKAEKADFVIDNSGSFEEMRRQVKETWEKIV